MNDKQRNISLDIVKLVLACMVVGIHSRFLGEYDQIGFYFYHGIFRIAVPVFLVINGYFFYQVADSKPITWLWKVFQRYVVWMLFYAYMWVRPGDFSLEALGRIGVTMLFGFNHLWYLSAIMGAALVTLLLKRTSDRIKIGLALILFLCGYGLQYFRAYNHFESSGSQFLFETPDIYRNFLFVGFPFFIMGYLIHKHDFVNRSSLIPLLVGLVFGVLAVLLESHWNWVVGSYPDPLDLLLGLLVISPVIFLLVMKSPVYGSISTLGLYANGIYFIHPFFLMIFKKFIPLSPTPRTLLLILISAVATCFLIQLNKKFRFIL
ncbi:MAG: acyltransferase [Planctomycetaceae bacterium]